MNEAVVNVLSGAGIALLGSWAAWWFSARQQRAGERAAERERQLALMQQLVVAASQLMAARKHHHETWLSAQSRVRVGAMAALEFFAVWSRRPGGWDAALAGLTPAARVVHSWDRGGLEAVAALAPHMARVAAAGLPLGMVEDPVVAAAAQRLMDACLEDQGEAAITEAVRGLRTAFYPGDDGARTALPG